MQANKSVYKKLLPGLIMAALVVLFVAAGVYYILFGALSLEEGGYLYTSRIVYRGLVPCADYWNGPSVLLPYVYGLPQLLLSKGICAGRATSLFFGLLTILLASITAYRMGGWRAAILSTAFIVSSPFAIHYGAAKVLPYSLAAFLLMLFFLLLQPGRGGSIRLAAAAIVLCAAMAVRLAVLPVILLFLIYVLLEEGRKVRNFLWAVTFTGIGALVFFGIIFAFNPHRFLSNFIGRFSTTQVVLRYQGMGNLALSYDKMRVLSETALHLFAPISLTLAGLWYMGKYLFSDAVDNKYRYLAENRFDLLLLSSIILMAIISFIPTPTYSIYHIVYFPLLAIFASGVVVKNWNNKLLVGVAIAMIFLTPFSQTKKGLLSHMPVKDVKMAADFIRQNVRGEKKMISFSPEIALEADFDVLPGLERGAYSYLPKGDPGIFRDTGLLTTPLLLRYINNREAGVIFLSERYFYRELSRDKATLDLLDKAIKSNYYKALEIQDYAGWGKAYIYLPKSRGLNK